MSEPPVSAFTPADVLRRVTAMGVLANAVTVWSYVRTRLEEAFPERAASAALDVLPVDEETLTEWLDDFLDTVETQRSRLARHLNRGSQQA